MRYVWEHYPDNEYPTWVMKDTQSPDGFAPNRIFVNAELTSFQYWKQNESGYYDWSDPIPIPEGLNELEAKAYALATWRMRM